MSPEREEVYRVGVGRMSAGPFVLCWLRRCTSREGALHRCAIWQSRLGKWKRKVKRGTRPKDIDWQRRREKVSIYIYRGKKKGKVMSTSRLPLIRPLNLSVLYNAIYLDYTRKMNLVLSTKIKRQSPIVTHEPKDLIQKGIHHLIKAHSSSYPTYRNAYISLVHWLADDQVFTWRCIYIQHGSVVRYLVIHSNSEEKKSSKKIEWKKVVSCDAQWATHSDNFGDNRDRWWANRPLHW